MTVIIIGVDPGKTTGIFIARVQYAEARHDTTVRCDYVAHQVTTHGLVAKIVDEQLASSYPVYVACENYIITARTARLTQQPDALKLIGVLEHLTLRCPRASFTLQPKSDAARIASNRVLKRIGWWQSGGWDHANDAARHALLLLAGVDPIAFASLMSVVE